ncbi:hypothetical protein LDL59_11555 [Kaistella anthropi]|nr:hypothetical protein [Kaistella anthropi]
MSHSSGLVNIKLSNGKYLVDGKKINAFTNEEEAAVKLDEVVPFRLESKLIEAELSLKNLVYGKLTLP